MGVDAVFQILGFIVGLLVFGFGIVKVLDKKAEDRSTRMEQRHREEMAAIRQDIVSLHERVNKVKDQYVKQETHDRDISMIHQSISEFRSEMRQEIKDGFGLFNQSIGELRKDFTKFLMDISSKIKPD